VDVGWFYLVTGVDSARDEGTKGFVTSGAERYNPSPCTGLSCSASFGQK
jgi:hypothetical protein